MLEIIWLYRRVQSCTWTCWSWNTVGTWRRMRQRSWLVSTEPWTVQCLWNPVSSSPSARWSSWRTLGATSICESRATFRQTITGYYMFLHFSYNVWSCLMCTVVHLRLVAAYEEQQKLQKESESSKRKAENGYDRWIWEPGLGHFNTSSQKYL